MIFGQSWTLGGKVAFRLYGCKVFEFLNLKVFKAKVASTLHIFMDWACLKTALSCQLEGGRQNVKLVRHSNCSCLKSRRGPLSSGWSISKCVFARKHLHKTYPGENWNIIHSFELACQSGAWQVQKSTFKQGKLTAMQVSSKRKRDRNWKVIWQPLYLLKLC